MLTRAIHELHCLKHIHSIVPDQKLGQALRAKLTALDLRAGPSPGPSALRQLLECLVYFRLGQSPVTASAVSLVREELPRMTGAQLSRTIAACCALSQHDVSLAAVPLLADALPSLDGAGTVRLVESLAAAGVRHEDVWAQLAEHCIRRIDGLSGRQLCRVIECFHARRVHYPDFYVVAERHICAQPSSYLAASDLRGVVECYRGLGMPIVALLAATSARSAEGFDDGLAAVAPTRQRRGRAERTARDGADAVDGAASSAVDASFVSAAVRAMRTADAAQLTDMLQKCEGSRVMRAEVMEAAAERLLELHGAMGRASALSAGRVMAIARVMLGFDRREYFVRAALPLSRLLDRCADTSASTMGHRFLLLADATLRLFPAETQPSHFYTVFVREIRFADVATGFDAARLPLLVGVMMALRAHGGPALLERHIPTLTHVAANAPLRVRVELAAMLAPLPAARRGFLPDLFAALASRRSGLRGMTVREALLLLKAMSISRQPCGELLLAVVDNVRRNHRRLDTPELVGATLQLAMLGFGDIEFYSFTATYVLERAPHTTVQDLCKLLYAFTFVLKGVIRVVQQMMPRLRVAAGHAGPREITLLLYSVVRLGIDRHAEVTAPFCERAVHILAEFKGEELASCLSSMRALRLNHEGLLAAASNVLIIELTRREEMKRPDFTPSASPAGAISLTDAQLLAVAAAVLERRPALLPDVWHAPLRATLVAAIPDAGAGQTHLIAVALAALTAAPCEAAAVGALLQRASAVCARFPSGPVAAEVLLAVYELTARSTRPDTRGGGHRPDDARALMASPLAAHVTAHLPAVMANAEVRDRLRGKGLLATLAGVSAPFAVEEADRIAPRDVPLREALLRHHKASRGLPAPKAGGGGARQRRRGGPALQPTRTASTAAGATSTVPKTARGLPLWTEMEEEETGKAASAAESPTKSRKTGSRRADTSGKRKVAKKGVANEKHHINFGVETQKDVEEFEI